MKKLKLVKPWRMRVVRQNLSDIRTYGAEDAIFVPCLGPQGAEASNRTFDDCPRAACLIGNIRAVSNNAPLSGTIFVQDNPRLS